MITAQPDYEIQWNYIEPSSGVRSVYFSGSAFVRPSHLSQPPEALDFWRCLYCKRPNPFQDETAIPILVCLGCGAGRPEQTE